MVWCAEPEGRYIGPIPENGLRLIVRTAASQKVSQVAEENLENMDNNCKQKQIQRKRGAEGTRAMSTQRFMWNYGTSKKPKGLESRYHQILDGPIGSFIHSENG